MAASYASFPTKTGEQYNLKDFGLEVIRSQFLPC